MKITLEQRKLLTEELLKECWHEWRFAPEDVTPCLKCRSRVVTEPVNYGNYTYLKA